MNKESNVVSMNANEVEFEDFEMFDEGNQARENKRKAQELQIKKVSDMMNARVRNVIENIYNPKNNPNGVSPEMAFHEIIKMKNVVTLDCDGQLYIYDEEECFYKKSNDEDVSVVVSKIATQYEGLSKYVKAAFFTSTANTVLVNMKASSSYTKFKKSTFSINVVDRTGMKHVLNMRLMNHETHGLIYIAEKALPSHNVNFKIYTELNIDNFVDHSGHEFELGKQYFYRPKVDRKSPFFKYLMNNMFTDESFETIEKHYYGAVVNGMEMATSILRLGKGRNGKGLRTRADKLVFNGKNNYQIANVDFNNPDRASFFVINKMRWIISNEIKKEKFNEQFFKMIVGKDSLAIRALYQNMNTDGIKADDNSGMIINANYNDLFVLSDGGPSMQERITPVETANAVEIVEGLFQVITEGGVITSEKFCKAFNDGNIIDVSEEEAEMSLTNYVDWMLEGGIEFKASGKRMASENYGKKAVDFKKNVIDKMSGAAETFEELEMLRVQDGWGCSINELYQIFLKASGKKNYSLIKFSKELKINYKKVFGEDLPMADEEKRAFCKVYDSKGEAIVDGDGHFLRTHSKIVGVCFNNIKCEFYMPCGRKTSIKDVKIVEDISEILDAFNDDLDNEMAKDVSDKMKRRFKK